MTGEFNRVSGNGIESLSAMEQRFQEYGKNIAAREKTKGHRYLHQGRPRDFNNILFRKLSCESEARGIEDGLEEVSSSGLCVQPLEGVAPFHACPNRCALPDIGGFFGPSSLSAAWRTRRHHIRAILAVLIGCGLRRSEVAALTFGHIQQRDDRSCIVDLVGKPGRVRTVPMPTWVNAAIESWTAAASLTDGRVFRPVIRGDGVRGDGMTEKILWQMLKRKVRCAPVPELDHFVELLRHQDSLEADSNTNHHDTVAGRADDPSEVRIRDLRDGYAESRRVGKVDRVRAQLQAHALGDRHDLE